MCYMCTLSAYTQRYVLTTNDLILLQVLQDEDSSCSYAAAAGTGCRISSEVQEE
jgi:hypothetical protein